jgi:hypothetical protein
MNNLEIDHLFIDEMNMLESLKLVTPREEYNILVGCITRVYISVQYTENDYQYDLRRYKRYLQAFKGEDEVLDLNIASFIYQECDPATLSKQIDEYVFNLLKGVA